MVTNGRDIAEALASALSAIPDVRVYAFGPDTFLPPGIAIQQPTISWTEGRTFDSLRWEFPLLVAVARNTEREAQRLLYRLVGDVAEILDEDSNRLFGVVQSARLLSASPATVTSNGQEFPGYSLTVEVIA